MPCKITIGVTMIMSERPNSPRGSSRFNLLKGRHPGILCDAIRNEHIAHAPNRLNVKRQLGIFLDLAPQPRDLHIDRALERNAEPGAEIDTGEWAARICSEQFEK